MSVNDVFEKYMKEPDKDKQHAVLSASGSERWLGCPGSIRLSHGLKQVEGEAARRGTNTHTLIQFILENTAWKWLLDTPAGEKFKEHIEYDEAMLKNAMFAVKYVWQEREDGQKLFTEMKVKLEGVGFGTSDVILWKPYGVLHVMDYKNGTKVVEVVNNPQALYYACAAADAFNWEFSTVKLTIIQPNAPHKHGHVRTWETDERTLMRAYKMLQKGAEATRQPNAPLVKNDSWCWFCPARQKCPEHTDARAQKVVRWLTAQ